MAEYGIPYMGSKDKICDELVRLFPKAERFYDLFGGGFSVTHAMMLRRKNDYKEFHFNEIKADLVDLIRDAISGKYNYDAFKPKFIGRDEFFSRIDEPYIRVIWSFGSDQKTYLFSKEIEPYKKSMHNAIVFNEFDELSKKVFLADSFKDGYSIKQRRLFLRNRIEYFRLNGIPEFLYPYLNEKQKQKLTDNYNHLKELQRLEQLERLERLQRLQQLEQLQRLQRLQQLEQLQRLQQLEQLQRLERLEQPSFTAKSYDQVEIKENSIVYCDPPYKGTAEYGNSFDTGKFLDWAHEQKEPVFISEYNIDDKRFKLIKVISKRSMLSATKDKCVVKNEKIYINNAAQVRFCGS